MTQPLSLLAEQLALSWQAQSYLETLQQRVRQKVVAARMMKITMHWFAILSWRACETNHVKIQASL